MVNCHGDQPPPDPSSVYSPCHSNLLVTLSQSSGDRIGTPGTCTCSKQMSMGREGPTGSCLNEGSLSTGVHLNTSHIFSRCGCKCLKFHIHFCSSYKLQTTSLYWNCARFKVKVTLKIK